MVIVLSAVALAIMTALIYMITMGTQISGLQKRYKTALEAGEGGGDVFYQLIASGGHALAWQTLAGDLNTFSGVNFATNTTPVNCNGLVSGVTYPGLAVKTYDTFEHWSPECNRYSITIDPADAINV